MSKKIVRYLSVLLAVSILFSGISLQITTAFADEAPNVETPATQTQPVEDTVADLQSYAKYTASKTVTNKADAEVKVPVTEFAADGADVTAKENSIFWNVGDGNVTWTFDVPKTALYNLKFVWETRDAKGKHLSGVDVITGVKIDGKYLFDGSDEVVLSRLWKNKDTDLKTPDVEEPRTDAQGNEYAHEQEEIEGFVTTIVRDYESAVIDPFEFELTEGTHTITLVEPEQSLEIKEIAFVAPETVKSYADVSASYQVKDLDADVISIEGENADVKTSSSIIPKANNSDAGMSSWDSTSSDPYHTKINYIGSTSWQSTGNSLTWSFDVKEAGYYYINLRYKQSDLVNGNSYRWLKVDGKTPFEEAKKISFPYGTSWKHYTFADDKKNPYYIYLDKGPHTISMEVTVADMSVYFDTLKELVDTIGDKYIEIVMITSESPDLNRDYELDKQIPGFIETLTDVSNKLGQLSTDMTNGTGKASQAVASIDNMKRVVDNMLKSPYIAQQYVSEYYSNYTSLSSWLYDMIKMPLSIDQIQLVPAGQKYNNLNANIFESLYYGTLALISSFTSDYSLTGEGASDANTIRLWVNWGQDQAAVLNSLIQGTFTQNKDYWYDGDGDGVKEPVNVQVEIVNASLINGILAGNYPDMSLQMARTEPVNLGIRGALADLSKFPDFKDVIGRFQDGSNLETGAVAPYTYAGKTYALPDTQNFMLMFYRKDILERLGLDVPKTWDEYLYCSTVIQRDNMNVYVPFTQITTSTTVNAGIGNLHLYPTLMWQHNLSIYNKDGTATAINSKEALKVFEQWTDFYLENGFLKEADFYNRLRVGVMPLGIAPYSTYMTLYSTAPEIRGRWGVAMVPGTENENGKINRTVAGSGTGCSIIEKSDKKEQAWLFLKWWTSADTQTRYNNNLQSILGMVGRNAVSNVEAFNNLAWDKDDLVILNKQWEQIKEVQEVPGSYDVTRSIDQAFWAVLEDEARVKDAVTKWSMSADKEITRKIKEYDHVINTNS
ncbi:MAG: extracellular solute-binding protein [Clostridia bacterium]|nr:extracellular solute-binding protein [Clostridia bacterium]